MRGARLLTLLGGKRRYNTSTFAAWTPVVGAAADGVASALGDWLGNLVVNGEFTEDTAGWTPASDAVLTRRDFAIDPSIAPTGGVNEYGLEIAFDGTAYPRTSQSVTSVNGAFYAFACRAYEPSVNTDSFVTRVSLPNMGSGYILATEEDTWETLARVAAVSSTSVTISLWNYTTTAGDVAYFDAVTCYRQNTPLLSPHRAASGVWTWAIAQPAAPSIVPWSALVRYLDASNYWEVRTKPNTAGNDLELVEVVAGVETTRAAADVDWTAEQTDELRITARGTTIGVEHRKHGEAVWTAGLSYASATAHQTAGQYGQMQWGTGAKRAASVRWNQ